MADHLFWRDLWQALGSWGSATSFRRRHPLSVIAVTWTLAACGYSQQPARSIASSNVQSNSASESTFWHYDGHRFIVCPEKAGFQNTTLSSLRWRLYYKQDESVMDRHWSSPFVSEHAASQTCNGCTSARLRNGKSECEQNYSLFDSSGLASLNLGVNDQQSPPLSQKQEPSADSGAPKHIFVFVPAFHVSYQKQFRPLTPREKFDEWGHGTYDVRGLFLYAGEAATLEHSSRDGFCGYGQGWGGYGKCFGSMELDANISSFLGDFLFPVVLHQDPRFFRLGEGPFRVRLAYALSRVFITHADSGRTVFFSSATAGSLLAAAASNLYFPAQDRGFGPSMHRLALDFADTALFNVAAEFWPDVRQRLGRALPKP